MEKIDPDMEAAFRLFDPNYDRPMSVDLTHPVMQEFYRTYVEPKIVAHASAGIEPAGVFDEQDDPDLEVDQAEEYPSPEIQQDIIDGLNQLASKAAHANNERAAYLIELAAAEIKGFSEE